MTLTQGFYTGCQALRTNKLAKKEQEKTVCFCFRKSPSLVFKRSLKRQALFNRKVTLFFPARELANSKNAKSTNRTRRRGATAPLADEPRLGSDSKSSEKWAKALLLKTV